MMSPKRLYMVVLLIVGCRSSAIADLRLARLEGELSVSHAARRISWLIAAISASVTCRGRAYGLRTDGRGSIGGET